jgi:hypothetical protein
MRIPISWMTPLRISSFLLVFVFISPSVSMAQEKSPVEVVNLFVKGYGGSQMDAIADYTTPAFRDNKPKSVWVVDTWKALHQLKYQKLKSSVIGSRIVGDKAVVVTEAKIRTAAGDVAQKELYYLVNQKERWLIDDLQVTEEEIDIEEVQL